MPANRAHTVVAWDDNGPVTQEMHDTGGRSDSVAQPDPSEIGPTTGQVSDAGEPEPEPGAVDTSEVPTGAAEVVAWIKAGDSEDEQARRAGLAWTVEWQRPEGVRSTVESEVDKHLTDLTDAE